jgi:hypothetical protein
MGVHAHTLWVYTTYVAQVYIVTTIIHPYDVPKIMSFRIDHISLGYAHSPYRMPRCYFACLFEHGIPYPKKKKKKSIAMPPPPPLLLLIMFPNSCFFIVRITYACCRCVCVCVCYHSVPYRSTTSPPAVPFGPIAPTVRGPARAAVLVEQNLQVTPCPPQRYRRRAALWRGRERGDQRRRRRLLLVLGKRRGLGCP